MKKMFYTFEEWFEKYHEGEKLPYPTINGSWFVEHKLPTVVACTCCSSTMALPSALIDEDNHIYCTSCVDFGD